MITPEFLSLEEVLRIHRDQLDLWGGSDGILNEAMLASALGQAEAVFSFLEGADLYDIAAAYAFSISQDQPFVDGNKRTGLDAAVTFLEMNEGPLPRSDGGQLFEAMMRVANGALTRAGLADVFRRLSI